ncbi:hypothetical protein ADIS_4488 [Lunatimonas lonarensis]|uniref:Lipoprotein n=2 Tax=Lunatimonas lonarensis TaxID=1232681 RepID=R7ZLT5_9BACT|nr:hypothetical protein ADIS_4488 [Lunatimonas lonarensis]
MASPMKYNLLALLLLTLLFGCDDDTEETMYEEESVASTEKEIILHSETSYWLSYEGVIPCADCDGIKMELKLENNPDKTTQSYELSETYLGTADGDRKFLQSGQIEISYGITGEPNVFVINLLNENLKPSHRFIQEANGKLSLLTGDSKRNPTDQNYILDKK